jgi:predicted O-linked N-acetylglucosamine transferase (SPINDLY family)
MTALSQQQKNKIINLFKNKKFTELELEIENISSFKDRSPFLSNMLGVVKLRKIPITKKDFEEARKMFKDSYEKDPNYIDAMCNLAHVSLKLRNFDFIFKDLKKFKRDKGYNAKVYEALARILFFTGEVEEALVLFEEMINKDDLSQDASANFLSSLNYSTNFSQLERLNYCKKVNEKFKPDNLQNLIDYEFEKNPKNLNIGFISPDFIEHSVTDFLIGTLEELKKRNFKVHAFNLRKEHELDSVSDSLKDIFDGWYDLESLSDLEAANVIRKNKINILINLVGYFSNNKFRIMKYKPAPLQMLWMGYVNTTGMKEMDYIIADPNLIKETEKNLYSEKIINLPNIWNCHSGIKANIEIGDLPYLENNHITFGCFNNSSKISKDVIKVWSQILSKIKHSKLIIKAPSNDSEIAQLNILKNFKYFNIDSSKIIFYQREKIRNDHLKLYNKIDVTLDTFPYPGVTTSMESIWMGVPVLTLEGNNFVSRCGESINLNLNMPEFIAKNKNDYINKAIAISDDKQKLVLVRKSLRKTALNSPLFDMSSFGQHFSNLLNKVWEKHPLK